jgi:outer membrane protein assembly factor BamB
MRSALSLTLLLLVAPLYADDNWPGFRGPKGDGHSAAKNIPTMWTETENVLWKVPVHDKGWSSPVVWGNQVWLTTAKANGTEFFAMAFDKNTGKIIHDLKLLEIPKPTDISQYNSYASPTPAIEEGRIYVHFGSFGTFCLDTATGKEIWKRTNLECDHFRGPASSPAVDEARVYLLFDGADKQYVVALDKKTGETIWLKDRKLPYLSSGDLKKDGDFKKAYATPSVFEVNGKKQVVCSAAMGTIAHDAATGEEVWRVIHDGMNEACRPILAHDLVILTAGHKSKILAVKAGQTGDLTKTGITWQHEKIGPTRPSPLVIGSELYMVNDTGILFCLDAKTGKKQWEERLDGKFSASPIYVDGNIIAIAENGKVFVVKGDKAYTPIATNKLDVSANYDSAGTKLDLRCMASPAAVDGKLFLRSATHLYCVGKK